jgi:Fe-S oxidoreductase
VRRLGNEYIFDRMAKANVRMFQDKGIQKIITLCPHCYSTLKNDYRQYGLDLQVWHHAEFIEHLLDKGLLNLKRPVDTGRTVFHDSCYLGRHNGVYEAPRAVIREATGRLPHELDRHHGQSFCCGAGGGRMWMEEHLGTRINLERVSEALSKCPDTVCVTCPYCMTMFEDGLKDKGSEEVRVKDIAEIVAEGLS